MRVRLCFSKSGPLRFIGHLDLQRVFQRAVRRAEIPVAYSQGFNPHMLLSFALPLPLGMESSNDYADLIFDREVPFDWVAGKINECAPEGLHIKKVYPAVGKAAAQVVAADYGLKIVEPVGEEIIRDVLARGSIVIAKKTKKGVMDTDIRRDILSLEYFDYGYVQMRLSAGSERFLHPVAVGSLLLGEAPCPSRFARLELYKSNEEGGFTTL